MVPRDRGSGTPAPGFRIDVQAAGGDRRHLGRLLATRAVPTHVVLIDRVAESRPTRIETLGAPEILSALLHQTVIPNDPAAAKAILTVITRSARSMRGVRFAIGDDAYGDPAAMQALEAALE